MNLNSAKIFPIIDLGDYVLREKCLTDAEDFLEYYADPQVNEYIVSNIPRDVEEAKTELKYWRDVFYYNDGVYFALAEKNTDKMIGSVGVSGINRNHGRIELSYDLAPQYWNRGIMTKATLAVVKYVFETMHINRIEAFALPENKASARMLEKCGFEFEGNLRQHRFFNGKYVDIGIYSLLRIEFLTPTA